MDCSMPGLPVHHQLPEFTQTHAHRVSDAIQPSHPLSPPFPFAISLSQHQGLFQRLFVSGGQSIGTSASASALLIISQGWCPLGLFWSPFRPRGSQESFSAPQFKSINSLALSLLYGPTLTPGKTIALTRWIFVGKVISLLFNTIRGENIKYL